MPDHTDGTPQNAVSGSAGNQNQPSRPINYAAATKNGLGDPSAVTSRSGSVQSVETAKPLDGRSPRGNNSRQSPKGSSTNHSERNGPVMSQQKVNSPSDKFIQSIIPSIGADTEVVTSNGSRIDGLFHSVNNNGDVVLQDAALTNRMGSLSASGAEDIVERDDLYLVSKNDFVEVLIKDVNSYPSPQMMRGYDRGFDSPQHSHSSAPLETDENLARASHGGAGGAHRELEEWNDNSVSFPTNLGDDIDDGPGYDVETMFRKNAMLSDKKSTFDDEMTQYTTVLRRENSVEFQQRMQRAGRIANEIEREKAKAKNRGRGQIDPEERDYADEEMVFSGVHRPDPRQNGPPPPRNAYANQDARSSAPARYPPPNNNNNNRRGSSDMPSFNSNKPDSNFPRSDSFQNERGRAGHNPAGVKDTLPSQWRRSEPPQPPSAPSPIRNPPSLPPVNQAAQSSPPTVASPRPSQQAVKLPQQPQQAATPHVKAVPEAGRPTFVREPTSSTSQNVPGPSPANQNVSQQKARPPPVTQNIQSFNAGATVSPSVPSPASSREPCSHKPPQNAWQNQRRGTPTGDGSKGQEGRESQSVRASLPVQRSDASQQQQQQQPPPSSRPPQQGGQQPANRQASNSSSQEKFESNSGGQRKSQSGERVERNDGRNSGNQGGCQQQQQQAGSGTSSGDERSAVRRQDSRQDGGGKEYGNQGGQQWINSNTSKTFVNSNVVQNQNVRGNYQGSRGGNRNNNNRADRDNYQPRSKNASPSVIHNENRSREGSGSRRESVASADRESTGSRGGQFEGKPAENPNLNQKKDNEQKTKDTKLNPDAAEFVPNVNAPEFVPSFAKIEQQPHNRTSPKRMSSGENLSMEQQQFAMQMHQAQTMVAYQQLCQQQQQQQQQLAASQGGPGPSISPTNAMMMMLGPQGSYVSPAPNPQYAGQPMAPQQAMYAGAGQNSVGITQAQAFQAAQIAAQAHQQHQQQQQSFQSVSPNILQQRPPNFAQMPNYPNQVYQAYSNPGQAPMMFVSPGYGGQGDPLMIPTTQMQYMSPHLQQQLQSNPMLYQFQAPPTGPYQSAGHPAGFLHMPAPPPSGYAQYMQAAQMQPPVMNGNGGYPNMNMPMMAPPPNGGPNQGMVQQHMQSRGGPANQHGGQ
ncbi:hypothetical protein RvY_12119-2 [Ramazzottius varieornatus]|uniref:LsmAD domain-containing protein n=1 Tax=Ramazzottius varieornatus TaxID=947166 RepID=A0A1D1VNU3_RAMVA|nr:hypothetical protein RvY_12119-2 [Ramazzottius varieornatus]